jgi:hypothetical protein
MHAKRKKAETQKDRDAQAEKASPQESPQEENTLTYHSTDDGR